MTALRAVLSGLGAVPNIEFLFVAVVLVVFCLYLIVESKDDVS